MWIRGHQPCLPLSLLRCSGKPGKSGTDAETVSALRNENACFPCTECRTNTTQNN